MEKVYIVYEENTYGNIEITCVFATLDRAKAFLAKKATNWITDKEDLKNSLEDIKKLSNLSLTTDGDFYLNLENSAGVTYYLRLECVIGAKSKIDKPRKRTRTDL